jgi:hypothetical protein
VTSAKTEFNPQAIFEALVARGASFVVIGGLKRAANRPKDRAVLAAIEKALRAEAEESDDGLA